MNVKRTAERLLKHIKAHRNLPQLRNNPSALLQAIDHLSIHHEPLITIGPEKGRIVTELIAKEKPRTFVECGGYVGYSAILFGSELRRHRANAQFWSLEYDPRFAAIIAEMVDLAGLNDIIHVVTGPAGESLRALRAEGKLERIDMLYLDHVEELYEQDLKIAMDELGLLKRRSTIVADNVLYPGAPEYQRYVRSHPGLRSSSVRSWIEAWNVMVCPIRVLQCVAS